MTYEIHTIDNNVFHTKTYTYQRDGSTDESPIVVQFVPSNGINRGHMHKFPVHAVHHIVVKEDRKPVPAWIPRENIDLARDMERGK